MCIAQKQGGDFMEHKSNKELAVDVAIAYIEAMKLQVRSNNTDTPVMPLKNTCEVIKSVYQTLENLDK